MNEKASEIVLEMTKSCIDFVHAVDPQWGTAYLRYYANDTDQGVQGSYEKKGHVVLFPTVGYGDFYDEILDLGDALRELLEKEGEKFVVCLLVVDSQFRYKIQFEYKDVEKWAISKMNGRNGIPEGLESTGPGLSF